MTRRQCLVIGMKGQGEHGSLTEFLDESAVLSAQNLDLLRIGELAREGHREGNVAAVVAERRTRPFVVIPRQSDQRLSAFDIDDSVVRCVVLPVVRNYPRRKRDAPDEMPVR